MTVCGRNKVGDELGFPGGSALPYGRMTTGYNDVRSYAAGGMEIGRKIMRMVEELVGLDYCRY